MGFFSSIGPSRKRRQKRRFDRFLIRWREHRDALRSACEFGFGSLLDEIPIHHQKTLGDRAGSFIELIFTRVAVTFDKIVRLSEFDHLEEDVRIGVDGAN